MEDEFNTCEKLICFFRLFIDVVIAVTILYYFTGNMFRRICARYIFSRYGAMDKRTLAEITAAESLLKDWKVDPNSLGERFSDITGMDNEINDIMKHVIYPLQVNNAQRPAWLRPPKGILIEGPRGSGKTLLVKAIAKEAGCTLYNVNPLVIMCEKNVHVSRIVPAFFSLALKTSPSIVCIENIDEMLKLRPEVESESLGVVRNQFINYWDLVTSENLIMVIGTSTFVDNIDLDVRSRMSVRYQCRLPDQSQIENFLMDYFAGIQCEDNVNMHAIATRANNVSYRQVKDICENAMDRTVFQREEDGQVGRRPLRQSDLIMAVDAVLNARREAAELLPEQ